MSENSEEKMESIKRKDRTYLKLSEWYKNNYAKTDICKNLLKTCPQEVDTVDYKTFNEDEFHKKY